MDSRMVIVGGGAAGFFAALAAAEAGAGHHRIRILEASPACLAKVRASGGGRCNLSHAEFSPRELCAHYPRGSRELLGPFHSFGPQATMQWFEEHGVPLKCEPDGRIFPVSDNSGEVVDCLLRAAERADIGIDRSCRVSQVIRNPNAGHFTLSLAGGGQVAAEKVLLAAGGGDRAVYTIAADLGHTIVPPAPALCGFKIVHPLLDGLAGLALDDCEVKLPDCHISERGPILITHYGLSGPAMLRLSSHAARHLLASGYRAGLLLNLLPGQSAEEVMQTLHTLKSSSGQRTVKAASPFRIPQRLWKTLVGVAGLPEGQVWARISRQETQALARLLTGCELRITGPTPNRDEMVTAGGVKLSEVNFKTMESRICPNLYVAGELLDIDGLTGGFNLQAAWTTGWLAGHAMAAAD